VTRAPSAEAIGPATLRWRALGTGVLVRVCDGAASERARAVVAEELAAIDLACSRFREDSELSRLNRRSGRPTRVGPRLLEAIELSLRAAALTDGDVDPSLGRSLELLGYDRDWEELAHEDPRASWIRAPWLLARVREGWRTIRLNAANATVTVPYGIRLDLGATAKAWAADRAATRAAQAAGCPVLVSIGGDIATAGGAPAGGWLVRVADDHRTDAHADGGQTIAIDDGGLATSSTTVRRWRRGRVEAHHILDPRTGTSAAGEWRTASVAAASCAEANIASTAAIVRGGAAAPWLAKLGLPARLVRHDGSTIELAGWPAP
jgi:thiamine biosynthesis lipoprotein